jgi:Fe-S oxidoreductase
MGDVDVASWQARGGRAAELAAQLLTFQRRHADRIREEFPDIPRRVSGYNLPALLPENGFHLARAVVGSESTLCLVLEATVELIDALPHRMLVALGFPDVFAAADRVPEVMSHRPVAVEGLDEGLIEDLRRTGLGGEKLALLPGGNGWLLVEFGARTREEALERSRAFARAMSGGPSAPAIRVVESREEQEHLWQVRESGLAATAHVEGRHRTWPGWEDSAVPPERLGAYLRDLRALFDRHGYRADLYGHFGQGCVHCRIDFELRTAEGIARFRRFLEEAADLVRRHGGSPSGEHGDGQARGELLARVFSPAMIEAHREFKRIWDPDGRMNPGKLVDARPLDADLRLGTRYDPPEAATWFQYPEDLGSFAHATLRCVGVGKCRKTDSGTMCPSYMATREETHTTRGRARLLFEMLEGDPLERGWRSEHVREALDLCLACKGCKAECPVHVDMATYKAEFLAHYYQTRRRPVSAHLFGRIGTWTRVIAALNLQGAANAAMALPGVSSLARHAAGIAAERRIPAFAPRTFRARFADRRRPEVSGGERVILWPDTFNDHFHPETLEAAVHVLEQIGCAVEIPRVALCCGRPLYDVGLLDEARARLQAILSALDQEIRAGVPVLGLEPSCVSVFRDELTNMFPRSEQAHRLKRQVATLGEFVDQRLERLRARPLSRHAIVHGHCHAKAIMRMDADRRVLDALGLRAQMLDAGCCGMAGAFGFEAAHYRVSMAIGERVLLPAVRSAPRDALVIADGFSCREQIEQGTGRRALHLAEVVAMALDRDPVGERVAVGHSTHLELVGDGAGSDTGAVAALARSGRPVIGAALVAGGLVLAWRVSQRDRRARSASGREARARVSSANRDDRAMDQLL